LRIVGISDTHNLNLLRKMNIIVPDGDVLIHCGDATMKGSYRELCDFAEWFKWQPHKHKIFVAGNHDLGLDPNLTPPLALQQNKELFKFCHYLDDSGVEIDGVKFWGSPWQPWFMSWGFNLPRGAALKEHWDKIPMGTDVLITHSPPYGILDKVYRGHTWDHKTQTTRATYEYVGCRDMLEAVQRVKPKFHLFGHIHGTYGCQQVGDTWFYNCSIATERYDPTNMAFVIDYPSEIKSSN
jgi:hypothetical protein